MRLCDRKKFGSLGGRTVVLSQFPGSSGTAFAALKCMHARRQPERPLRAAISKVRARFVASGGPKIRLRIFTEGAATAQGAAKMGEIGMPL